MALSFARIVMHDKKFVAAYRSEYVKRLHLACQICQTDVQRKLRLHSTKAEGPSKPGEVPHAVSGDLSRDYFHEVDEVKLIGIVGSPLRYSLWLELGLENLDARPHLRPTMIANETRVRQILSRPLPVVR
jgi:hypothetical protein